jgi:hypothetical protein
MKLSKIGYRKGAVIVLCVFWSIFSILPIFAQSKETEKPIHWHIGLEGGYARNTLYSSTGYRAFTEYEAGNGFLLGIPVRYQFVEWFALQSGFQYIQKNYSLVRNGPIDERVYNEWTNSFLELPVTANFSFGGSRLRGFLNAGGYLGLWIDSHIKGVSLNFSENPFGNVQHYYTSYDEQVSWNDTRDNRFEAGLLAGLGVQYAITGCTFYVEGRFNYGLTDLQKDYMLQKIPRINDTITIQAGVLFNADLFSFFRGGTK